MDRPASCHTPCASSPSPRATPRRCTALPSSPRATSSAEALGRALYAVQRGQREPSPGGAPPPVVGQGAPGGQVAAGPVHATSGVGRGAPEVEALDSSAWATQAGDRPEHQLLGQLLRATPDGALAEVGVLRVQLAGSLHPAV